MNKVNETDQWLLSGDCSICRRKKYCSKPCTKYKRYKKAQINALAVGYFNELTHGKYNEVCKQTEKL